MHEPKINHSIRQMANANWMSRSGVSLGGQCGGVCGGRRGEGEVNDQNNA